MMMKPPPPRMMNGFAVERSEAVEVWKSNYHRLERVSRRREGADGREIQTTLTILTAVVKIIMLKRVSREAKELLIGMLSSFLTLLVIMMILTAVEISLHLSSFENWMRSERSELSISIENRRILGVALLDSIDKRSILGLDTWYYNQSIERNESFPNHYPASSYVRFKRR